MTDQPIKTISTTINDPNLVHAELESHRTKAKEALGGHVHVVNQTTSSVPMHDATGAANGHLMIVTSAWKLAPPEPDAPQTDETSQG